jgi:hypothetical protein
MTGFIGTVCYNLSQWQSVIALSLIYPLHMSLGHAKSSRYSLVVSWQRMHNNLTVTTAHIKSLLYSVVRLCTHSRSTTNSTASFGSRLSYINYARTTRNTYVNCYQEWECTVSLTSTEYPSIVESLTLGPFLPSRCLAVVRYVTIRTA